MWRTLTAMWKRNVKSTITAADRNSFFLRVNVPLYKTVSSRWLSELIGFRLELRLYRPVACDGNGMVREMWLRNDGARSLVCASRIRSLVLRIIVILSLLAPLGFTLPIKNNVWSDMGTDTILFEHMLNFIDLERLKYNCLENNFQRLSRCSKIELYCYSVAFTLVKI